MLSIVGTRPEVIKMAPVIKALQSAPDFESRVCSLGQHRDMLQQALEVFSIAPDYQRDVMQPDQRLGALTAALLGELDEILDEFRPDWVLAQGDTTSVMVAALVSFYHRIPFGHVEAGLRTRDLSRPFPEELHRRVADLTASLYFAPTPAARAALLEEGCDPTRIHVTGNTIVDALHEVARRPYDWKHGPLARIDPARPIVLITAHRRESFGRPLRELCDAIGELATQFAPRSIQFVYPVHRNPNVESTVLAALGGNEHVLLLEPLDYVSLVQVMRRAVLVMTDSGGIQEEAPSFGVPVLVLRDTTERPEGCATGLVRLVGTDRHRITSEAQAVLSSAGRSVSHALRASPYGDGKASARIVSVLRARHGETLATLDKASVPA